MIYNKIAVKRTAKNNSLTRRKEVDGMFKITYGKGTDEKFNRIYRNCIEDNCECVISTLGELPMQEFLDILVEVINGIDTKVTENSVTIEYGFGDSITINVLSLDINGAIIELKF